MAIHQQQYPAVIIAQAHPPCPEERVVAIVRNIEALHALQHLRQRSTALLFDFICRYHCHRGGRFLGFLLHPRHAVHLWNVDLQQRFEREFSQIGRFVFRFALRRRRSQREPTHKHG